MSEGMKSAMIDHDDEHGICINFLTDCNFSRQLLVFPGDSSWVVDLPHQQEAQCTERQLRHSEQ